MASESNGQLHTYTCDISGCDETYEAAGDRRDVWASAKEEGWRCFQNDEGDWEHRCPEHVGRS